MDTSQPIIRPRYQDATPEQLARICNGVGPAWAPTPVRKLMTMLSSWFFDEASWNHHDFGYYIGCRECCRREYDHKFFMAMLRDARCLPIFKMILASALSLLFYLAVRLCGWTSFYYGPEYQPL